MESMGLDGSVWEVLGVLTMEEGQVAAVERSIARLSPEEAMRLKLQVVSPDPGKHGQLEMVDTVLSIFESCTLVVVVGGVRTP